MTPQMALLVIAALSGLTIIVGIGGLLWLGWTDRHADYGDLM